MLRVLVTRNIWKHRRDAEEAQRRSLDVSLTYLLVVPVLVVLLQYKYTGNPNAINASPIADCFGVFQIVVKISQVQIKMKRTGTTGYPNVRYGRASSGLRLR